MDTITTIPSLLASNGSAQPVTVALTQSELRLIAAAPELLEALEAMVREFDHVDSCPEQRDALCEAQAAIAKARGDA